MGPDLIAGDEKLEAVFEAAPGNGLRTAESDQLDRDILDLGDTGHGIGFAPFDTDLQEGLLPSRHEGGGNRAPHGAMAEGDAEQRQHDDSECGCVHEFTSLCPEA